MTDQIANMFSKIKNAITASNMHVNVNNSNMNRRLLHAMMIDGYIESYSVPDTDNRIIAIKLRYDSSGVPAIRYLRRISKLSRRLYVPVTALSNSNKRKLKRVHKYSTFILSTSSGVMSDVDARAIGIGGEVICEVAS